MIKTIQTKSASVITFMSPFIAILLAIFINLDIYQFRHHPNNYITYTVIYTLIVLACFALQIKSVLDINSRISTNQKNIKTLSASI